MAVASLLLFAVAADAIAAVAFAVADDVAVLVAVAFAVAAAVVVTIAAVVLLLLPFWGASGGVRVSIHNMYGGKAEWLWSCCVLWLSL